MVARWTGTITPERGWATPFHGAAAGIVQLHVNGAVIAAGEREFGQVFGGPPLPVCGSVDLRAGHPVPIQLDYTSATAWP